MKLNHKGFAVTSIVYSMLVLFLALVLLILSNLANRKVLFDKSKNELLDNLERNEQIYREEILNGAYPVLNYNLIPVVIADDGTVTKADLKQEWYKYEEKRWANAVILTDDGKIEADGTIKEESIESYFVWIPKYKYKLFNLGNYTTETSSKPSGSIAQEIDIVFGIGNTSDENIGECTTPRSSGSSGNCSVNDYMTHPAFLSFNTNGLWVGKFETTGSINNLTVKPGVAALSNHTVFAMYNAGYNYLRIHDSHMMKNTEWGAVAYLSHSKYGINKEIGVNNNSNNLTGYGATSSASQADFPGTVGTDTSVTQPYNTETGYKASTTGNITGIYDMSGGVHEYVASYVDGSVSLSGFTQEGIMRYDSKYFDRYNSNSSVRSFNYRILGDATGEFGPFYLYADGDGSGRVHNNWYSDNAYFVDPNEAWFHRGGHYYNGVLDGQFSFDGEYGVASGILGFRLVLAE